MSESEGGVPQGGTPRESARAGTGTRQLVGFHLGGARFAVDIARVHEIVKPPPLTPVPEMPPDFSGVIRLRDEVIVVADLRARFAMPDAPEGVATHIVILAAADRKVGVAVDAVSDVVRLTPAMLSPSPGFHGGVPVACIEGIARVGDDLVTILDVDALFPARGPYGEEPLDDLEDLFADAPVPGPTDPVAVAAPDPEEAGARLYREIGELARYINRVHSSVLGAARAPLPPASMRPKDLTTANDVLHTVTQETEIATMQVLANTEETAGVAAHLGAMLADLEQAVPAASEGRAHACDLADRMRVELDHVLALQNDTLTALSFQDLTGQKIAQVIALMAEVEERVLGLVVAYGTQGADRATAAAEQRLQDLKGAPEGGPMRQDRVDSLLAEFGF